MSPKLNFKKNDFETFEFLSVQYYQEAFISMINNITNDEDEQREKNMWYSKKYIWNLNTFWQNSAANSTFTFSLRLIILFDVI